jgi:diguanylate cyclase (GGDEF)-like protein/PAS domain S-box-containing protein
MDDKKKAITVNEIGLVIIGSGVSILYYYFEKSVTASQDLSIFFTIAMILMISFFTQLLINNINRSRSALREANENLEQKVRERTKELRESESKYRTIFENTGAATIIIEQDKTISLANSVFINMSGYDKNEIEYRKSFLDFIDETSHRKIFNDAQFFSNEKNFELKFVDKFSQQKDILFTIAPIPSTEKSVASLTDISDLKEAERQIYHQAFHDTLTNLPNRALFMEHLNMAIKRAKRRQNYHFAVVYLDIDRFKLVNDSLGHNVGDNLLIAFANRIQESLREIDTLARLGGDEFVILLEDIEDGDYASRVAERLQQELKQPFIVSESC